MLPSLGFQEIILLGVLALLVVGPKDLPLMLRKLGRWTAKLRAMAQEFRTGFDELARQAELDELKKEVDALRRGTNLSSLANEITKPLASLEDYAGVSLERGPSGPLSPSQAAPAEVSKSGPEGPRSETEPQSEPDDAPSARSAP